MFSSDEKYFLSAFFALLVHLILFLLLFFSFNWQQKVNRVVYVEMWNQLPTEKKVFKKKDQKTVNKEKIDNVTVKKKSKIVKSDIEFKEKKKKNLVKDLKKISEAREKREEEIKKRREKFDEVRKKIEKEKKSNELKFKQQQEIEKRKLEAKKLILEQEKLKAIAQKKQEDTLAEKLRDAENKRKIKEEKDTVNEYISKISSKVREKVVIPPDIIGNPEAIYEVIILPGGDVMEIILIKSSSFEAYDLAVALAIEVAEPLPVPDDPDLFQRYFRNFKFTFRPKE